jgi:hypothetical protein
VTRALVLLGLAALCAAQPAAQQPWDSWKELASNAGHYKVRYKLDQDPPRRGELFGLQAYVLDAAGKELRPKVALLADGDMPEHGHGLTRMPEVAPTKDGGFQVSGLRLHMPGRWQIYLDLVEGAHTERAQFDLTLE